MKKIFLLVSSLFLIKTSKAQIDTASVLNNLLNNKSSYVGQSCGKLLHDLPLEIKYYRAPIPFKQLPDTLQINKIELVFITNSQAVTNITSGGKTPQIVIYFTNPIPTPKRYFKRGQVFEVGLYWGINHSIYFGQAVVSDFKIYGL